MYRTAIRSAPRALRAIRPTNLASAVPRRFASTAPADRRGTWRGAAFRWALAIGAVYWYNTSPIFADEPAPPKYPAAVHLSDADLPTIDAVIEEKRRQLAASAPAPVPAQQATQPEDKAAVEAAVATTAVPAEESTDGPIPGSPEELDEEASQQGAYNPETGEINWDCPCLGGMAHGPCGEEFKAAFSCFVYSNEEPKGMDCIDKFQHMQDCFRKYPEIYGSELADDDEGEDTEPGPAAGLAAGTEVVPPESAGSAPSKDQPARASKPPTNDDDLAQEIRGDEKKLEEAVPKKSFDATDANKGKE